MLKLSIGTNKKNLKFKDLESRVFESSDLRETLKLIRFMEIGFKENNVYKLSDFINFMLGLNLKFSDEFARYKVYDMIIDICNNENDTNDYKYLVHLLKRCSDNIGYDEANSNKVTTVKLREIKKDLPIEEVILMLVEMIGLELTIETFNILLKFTSIDLYDQRLLDENLTKVNEW